MFNVIIYIIAGLGAGLGTGLAGLSAAAVISPMLITFCGFKAYEAIGVALASDVLASAISAYTYGKNKKLDIKNGLVILAAVVLFTVLSSFLASLVPNTAMGNFSIFTTFFLGIKFIIKPVMTEKNKIDSKSTCEKIIQSVLCGAVIGLICGFIGAGGGMMMLLILTSVLGYELKTAVGTSVFIMTFTALTGAVSHFVIDGMPDFGALLVCIIATFLGARIAAVFANKATAKTLNRATGIVLAVLGAAMIIVTLIQKL